MLLNDLIRENPALLAGGPLQALVHRAPRVLDFDNKRAWFRAQLRRLRDAFQSGFGGGMGIRINVRRSSIFDDSFHALGMRSADELRGHLSVHFEGEEGIDAGGVAREWYQVISREMFNPGYALFKSSDEGAFQPNPASYINPDHLRYFKFVGRVVAKALWDGMLLDAHFTRSFYKHILGQEVSMRDMEALDNGYYRNLRWILDNDIDGVLEATFSVEGDEFGRLKTFELKPGGRSIPVTQENKAEYVQLLVEHKLTASIRDQITAFLDGFHELIPSELVAPFSENELELLISGLPEIDVDDLRANTEYRGYEPDSPQIVWFWRAVSALSGEDKAKLLQFITGTGKVPLDGFGSLRGINGMSRFSIHRMPRKEGLPTSHTCFNQLDMPEYQSFELLQEKLLLAIREGCEGFGFG